MKVTLRASALPAAASDQIAPDPPMLIRALRQIGYSFEQALADLIDNSISAGAENVLVRFTVDRDSICSVAVADDGEGMTPARLAEAMKFGSETDLTRRTLGKYGMGMKLASLSHAQTVTVLTRRDGVASARRWSVHGIEAGWSCEQVSEDDAHAALSAPWCRLDLRRHGTVVVWDQVDRLHAGARGFKDMMRQLQRRLQVHLGMTFHRFIEGTAAGRKVRLMMDLQEHGAYEQPHFLTVRPLNPFGYSSSGHPDYPKRFEIDFGGGHTISAEACIWPANSDDDAYRLGNRAASRQGFWFYRNDRLIQAGGWNGVVQNDAEPHGSLARVRVDLPDSLDAQFGLNVQKSAVVTPPSFAAAVSAATSADGSTFDDYRRTAQQVYRRTDARAERELPLIPGSGVPAKLRKIVASRLAGGQGGRELDFTWAELEDETQVFEIDRESRRILLNRRLREGSSIHGGVDVQLLKMCLFFILQEDVDCDRLSGARRERVETINAVLGRTLSLS
ncbi:MAG: hypothetical protein RJA99_3309 [Pseudomonadota bacterium]|jgi:hypothetical protein